MSFFDGLYSYQIVLLLLGVVLFLVVAGAFLTLVIKGKPFGKLLPFFLIPVLMIGFPGIASLSFQSKIGTLTLATSQLQENPSDTALRQTLQTEVNQTASMPVNDPKALTAIASAQFALGDHQAAEAKLQAVLQKSPQLPEAMALKKRIDLDKSLTTLTAQVEQNPHNESAKASLQQAVKESSTLKIASPVFITKLAQAQAAVGNSKQALVLADKALQIQPKLAAAEAVKQRIAQ